MTRLALVFSAVLITAGCWGEDDSGDPGEAPIRGLKTVLISAPENSVTRRFPSVLQPSELTVLTFETPGKLGPLQLTVGQSVAAGDVLARLDDTEMRIQIASAEAAVEQARVTAQNAAETLVRQEELLARGVATKVTVDEARTNATAQAQALIQAERALDSAREALEDTDLTAPFDGTISSVDAQSFATVGAGAPIVTLYREGAFEVTFTVNYDTVNNLVVGTPARLILADDPSRSLDAVVTELGARAETVASFPVVIAAQNVPEDVRAGMAVEVQLDFPLPAAIGYPIPVSAAVIEGRSDPQAGGTRGPTRIGVYVYDATTGTVSKRMVTMAGVRENELLVIDGLTPGDRVASAGVSFLSDGMRVNLIEGE